MSATIKLEMDVRPFISKLEELRGAKGVAYGVVQSINRTAELAQATVREHVQEVMEVRKPGFTLKQAAILHYASVGKDRPYAELAVGQKQRFLMSFFEHGGERPKKGKTQSVPIIGGPARPSFAQPIPEQWRTKQLGFRRRKGSNGKALFVGKLGTYTVPDVGIFERPGPRAESHIVYSFVQDEQLPPDLEFEQNIRRIADRWFVQFMEQDLNKAIAYAEAKKRSA